MAATTLELHNVSFSHGLKSVLDDVSLSVSCGGFTGLLGPNGAGKSTIIRIAGGLTAAKSGTVCLGGAPLNSLSRAEVARRVAVVFQDAPVPNEYTVSELVLMGRIPHMEWFAAESEGDIRIARQAIALCGLESLAFRRIGSLSGGERQMAMLARALAQEPEILLLDEPTVHLDIGRQLNLLSLLRRMVTELGLGVLAVFHDINMAAQHCDKLLLLANSVISAQGSPFEVITTEHLRGAYGVAMEVYQGTFGRAPFALYRDAADASNGVGS